MRVLVTTFGSQGDIRPLVALGAGLRAAGHEVVFPSDRTFQSLIERHGLRFIALDGDLRAAMAAAEQDVFRRGTSPFALMRALGGYARELAVPWARQLQEAAQGADVVFAAGLGFYPGLNLAEAVGALPIGVALAPVAPTRAFPPPLIPPRRLPGFANLALHTAMLGLVWASLRKSVNQARREVHGLPPMTLAGVARAMKREGWPMLHAYSPALVPPPSDWPDTLHVTGAWHLEEAASWQPSAALARFLSEGPPPVYVGFGSMGGYDPVETTRLVLRALGGRRAVLAAGWGGLSEALELPPEIHALDEAPHDWLMPRMAAAVHHGGAGTTHAVARAGIPSIVVPFLGDQPFWAWRLELLGAAPRPIPRRRLTAESLAAALAAVEEPAMRARAAALGERLRAEQGVKSAIAVIEAAVAARRRG